MRGYNQYPYNMFASLFGPPVEMPANRDEAKRRYEQEVTVVHAALVELGVSVPGDYVDAKAVVKLNRLCGRSGQAFEGMLRGLSTLCNDAPLLVDRLTKPPAAPHEAGNHSAFTVIDDTDDTDETYDDGPGDGE